MRLLIFLLSVAMTWMAAAIPAAAEPGSVLMKTREGSLVLGGGEKTPRNAAKKDTLHTMLSREVKVYVFRGSTRVFPTPYVYGQTRFYPPTPAWQRPAGPYLETLIQKYANHYGVDPSLVRAVMCNESGFNPNAVSPKGAQGLMQLMPGTAALMGVNNPFDPEQNIAGGVGYLRHCLDSFGHNVPLAVAAYNAGPGRVARSQGVPAITETQAFVKNVMGTYTGRPGSLPEAKSGDVLKPKMATRPASDSRILRTPSRAAATDADEEKVAPRPRAKVIVVKYPSAKQVVVAKPAGAN
jgi:Transglycosylase SLT domain